MVTVEVGVERAARERVKFDCSTLDKHGFERLDTESVKRRSTVEKHGVIFDDLFEDVPHLILAGVHETFCALDVVAKVALDELVHNERLEEFECHFLWQTALIKFEFGADDDNRTTGIVDTFTEQVLTETALFAAEHSREGFEISVAGAGNRFASAAVVDQCVDCFLKHTFFVAHDDVGRAELFELFKTVVAVDDSAIQIVEVAGCKSAAV